MSSFFRLLASPALAVVASAQPSLPDHDAIALSDVVVTAHPYARSQSELANPTHILVDRELALRQSSSIGELLAAEPGVSSTWFGPGASRPIIRGLGGDRLRILQNSLGTADASVTSPDHAVALDPLLIERVEIIRGPASLLYGSSAVGGVVNVITHRIHQNRPERAIAGRAEARWSSVNEESAGGVVAEGGQGALAWHVDAYRRVADDVRIPGFALSAERREEEEDDEDQKGEADGSGRIPNTALRSDGGAGGLSWIGSRGYVGASFSGFNTLYGVPPGAHLHHEEEDPEEPEEDHAHEEEESVRIDLRQRRVDLEGEWRGDGFWGEGLRFKWARSDYRHQELEGDEVGTVFENQGHEGRLEWLHAPIGRFEGAAGLQYTRQTMAVAGAEAFLPPTRTSQAALFVVEEAEFGPVTWQVGARVERQEVTVTDASQRERDDHAASVSSGLVWTLNPTWTLALSAAHTARPPNAQELFADGPHIGTQTYEIGDAELGRERSSGLDLSLRRRTGRITGELTLFANRFDGYIFEQPTGGEADALPVYQYVQRDARLAGGELEVVAHLHETGASFLDLRVTGDLVRGRNTTDDENLPRITPPRLRIGLDAGRGPWVAGVEWQRVASQKHRAPRESPTAGYNLWSAYAAWRWSGAERTVDLFLRGTNLTDEEARVHTSLLKDFAPLPGRNVTIGVRLGY